MAVLFLSSWTEMHFIQFSGSMKECEHTYQRKQSFQFAGVQRKGAGLECKGRHQL